MELFASPLMLPAYCTCGLSVEFVIGLHDILKQSRVVCIASGELLSGCSLVASLLQMTQLWPVVSFAGDRHLVNACVPQRLLVTCRLGSGAMIRCEEACRGAWLNASLLQTTKS